MKKQKDITIVLDRSGSMARIKEGTIEGFNDFIKEQKSYESKSRLSLIQFNDKILKVYEGKRVSKRRYLDSDHFIPSGTTALLDAIGTAVESIEKRTFKKSSIEVILVIITDGLENSSSDFDFQQIKKLIAKKKAQGWKIIFMGASEDSIAQADGLKISKENLMRFQHTKRGIKHSFKRISEKINLQ